EARSVGLVELDHFGEEEELALDAAIAEMLLHPLVDEAFMRGVLVDDDDAALGLRDDIGVVKLRPRGAERIMFERRGAGLGRRHLAGAGSEAGQAALRRIER